MRLVKYEAPPARVCQSFAKRSTPGVMWSLYFEYTLIMIAVPVLFLFFALVVGSIAQSLF